MVEDYFSTESKKMNLELPRQRYEIMTMNWGDTVLGRTGLVAVRGPGGKQQGRVLKLA
jgi:hypothetical protein